MLHFKLLLFYLKLLIMNTTPKMGPKFSRRKILPILGGTLLLPVLGFSKTKTKEPISELDNSENYEVLLKPDGTTVRVKKSVLENSKVVKKNVSNSSFLNWLGRKL